ncbi:MAG: MBL fold metallo-hydrolase [Candidatus Latescibacterota bacterium]|nr:MBL fold metallo-hydrolase [Candidatus Latescibacterota bacterium]
MEIVPGIHRIEIPFGEGVVCVFLLVGKDHTLLIDTGTDEMPEEWIEPYARSIGLDLSSLHFVINTHADFDHTAGNASVREMCPRAIFMCYEADREMVEDIEVMIDRRYSEWEKDHGIGDGDDAKEFIRKASRHIPVDISLQGGEKLNLGDGWNVEIWHTPGHTRGHLTVYDPGRNIAIIADAALHNAVPRADGSPAFPPTYRHTQDYIFSLEHLLKHQFDILLTSHYPVYSGPEVASFLEESRDYVDRVDQALITQLQESKVDQTLADLTYSLGPVLGAWPDEASPYLCFPLTGHLEHLEKCQ